tara:strand:+ start:13518 stop:13922 length:405 start_codon:yes stop_codon:yes gene_type:complete
MLLFASTGFTIDKHFCKGKVADTSVFGKANSCNMFSEKSNEVKSACKSELNKKSQSTINKEKCCYNETISVDVTDELSSDENSSSNHAQLKFIASFILSSYDLFYTEEKAPTFSSYSPPLISKDIPILHQKFLI